MFEDLYSEPTPIEHQQIRGGKLHPVTTAKAATISGTRPVPSRLGPETSWSYFHPSRVDARYAPARFRALVHGIDPNLDVTWHPIYERWCVWVRNPRVTHRLCPGWQFLFPVQYPNGAYLPLDERTLAEIVNRSPRKWGNGRRYYDRILSEVTRDRRNGQKHKADLVGAIARDRFDACQIKNIGHGSKFALHHSGN